MLKWLLNNPKYCTAARGYVPGASPAGGQRGQCPPIFVFGPPIFFLPPTVFFWEEEVGVFGVRISANSVQKKCSDFGEDLCPPDFHFAPRSRKAGDAPVMSPDL